MPVDTLVDMSAKGEIGDLSIAAHPKLPVPVMREIVKRGDELALIALLSNPSLPKDVLATIRKSESPAVRQALKQAAAADAKPAAR